MCHNFAVFEKMRLLLSRKRLAVLFLTIVVVVTLFVCMKLPKSLNLDLVDLEITIHNEPSIDFETSGVIAPILVSISNLGTKTFEVSCYEFQEIVLLVENEEHPMRNLSIPHPTENTNPPGNRTRFSLDYPFTIKKGAPTPTGMRMTIAVYLDGRRFVKVGYAETVFKWPMPKEQKELYETHINVALELKPITLNIASGNIAISVEPSSANLSFISYTVRPETLSSKKSEHIVEYFNIDRLQNNGRKRYIQDPYLRMDLNKQDFPYDAYHTRLLIGVNGSKFPRDLVLKASLSLQSPNYIGLWDMDWVSEATVIGSIFTTSGRTQGFPHADSWVVINVGIGHPPDFVSFAEMVVVKIPCVLRLLSFFIAIIPFFVFLSMIWSRTRTVSSAKLIESLSVPIGVAVLVFIPIYGLTLDSLTSPFRFPDLSNRLYELLILYSAILVFGVLVRIVARER